MLQDVLASTGNDNIYSAFVMPVTKDDFVAFNNEPRSIKMAWKTPELLKTTARYEVKYSAEQFDSQEHGMGVCGVRLNASHWIITGGRAKSPDSEPHKRVNM